MRLLFKHMVHGIGRQFALLDPCTRAPFRRGIVSGDAEGVALTAKRHTGDSLVESHAFDSKIFALYRPEATTKQPKTDDALKEEKP